MPINNHRRDSHPYNHYRHRHYSQSSKSKKPWIFIIIILSLLAIVTYLYVQPIGGVSPQYKALTIPLPTKTAINWPANSQAAIGSVDDGLLTAKSNQVSKPTASTAKLVTAMTVLDKKPLQLGQKGPTITLTQNDVDIYNQYFAKDGSLAQVKVGEQLTQYQLLQGMMLPSANNYADTLAIWTFGSLEKYQLAAQKYVNKLGLKNTTVGKDASGFDPSTTSTAEDLTKLAVKAMKNKTLAEIVNQSQVDLPVAGVKDNTNWLLGADGVVGIKTGHTTEAGGVYVFASKYDYDKSHSAMIVGAVQGEPTVINAIHESRPLISQAKNNYKLSRVVKKGQIVATYHSPWGKSINAIAVNDVYVLQWKSKKIKPQIELREIMTPTNKGTKAGTITVGNISTDIILQSSLTNPDWQYRIFRYF
ncbi:MAG: serine hydrolase [Candidatus Saccharibacteria bacterium]|nr:serine hydrolase [Candidatus Saccharibacteria bacterium]